MADEALTGLRDALDDAIHEAYCAPLHSPREGEDPKIVGAIARAAVINDPIAMRRMNRIQQAAWDVVKARVE